MIMVTDATAALFKALSSIVYLERPGCELKVGEITADFGRNSCICARIRLGRDAIRIMK